MNRRQYLQTTLTGALSLIVPKMAFPAMQLLDAKIRFGLIADLHQDLIHDGLDRMQAFAKAMKKERPDATIQMGDFAHPSTKNQAVISLFNQTSCMPLHVIGNHDTDGGHTKQQCLDVWGCPPGIINSRSRESSCWCSTETNRGRPATGADTPPTSARNNAPGLGNPWQRPPAPLSSCRTSPWQAPSL
ncbi:MAG: metallophosphoesterase [Haliscomenobacter sp.]|nr:metallophosphoesterase [Haliscomenobacter sp.]